MPAAMRWRMVSFTMVPFPRGRPGVVRSAMQAATSTRHCRLPTITHDAYAAQHMTTGRIYVSFCTIYRGLEKMNDIGRICVDHGNRNASVDGGAAGPAIVRANGSERVRYDYPSFFSYARRGRLSSYPLMRAQCHWHDDWEFLLAEHGHLTYFVDGEHVPVREGQGIFVNARRLHYGYSDDGSDCEFLCVLLNPMRAGAAKDILERYILPIGSASRPPYLLLDGDDADSAAILHTTNGIVAAREADEPTAPLTALSGFYAIARHLTLMTNDVGTNADAQRNGRANMTRTREGRHRADRIASLTAMVDFIQENFTCQLTLAEIASAGSIGRSSCASIFRDYLNQSPIEYVTDVRIRAAIDLLAGTELPIAEVAARCGFRSPGFFSRTFRNVIGVPPFAYRKQRRDRAV
ncbi:helix-turn-helix domain-containing protein [Bifidobacterium simiiventris]|uniref:helix-turn-helix domain-containing protein n=1 Tax=Bifidobacterium simiiventris TaxID=2834434 RepID=UPI001C5896ED|nr:helix-turn-helix domain-containing protein [Bifidobacterium simiiventris]MBW3078419.1 helix-turn-helix domain-containing protein [Bifidobacterium simiiventris]